MLFVDVEKKKFFADLSKVLFGFPKTGKSSFASHFKAGEKYPAFITTEDGHANLNVKVKRVTTWLEFKQLVNEIEKNKDVMRKTFSCFVIDLVSDLDLMCQQYVASSLGIKDLADADYGKGFRAFKIEFQKEIQRLLNVLPVTFIAHAKEKKIEIEGEKVELQAPNISTSALEFINGKVDLIGFIIPSSKTKALPMITFRPTKLAMAGSRYKELAREFELNPDNLAESYNKIEQTFKPN